MTGSVLGLGRVQGQGRAQVLPPEQEQGLEVGHWHDALLWQEPARRGGGRGGGGAVMKNELRDDGRSLTFAGTQR